MGQASEQHCSGVWQSTASLVSESSWKEMTAEGKAGLLKYGRWLLAGDELQGSGNLGDWELYME